VDNNRIVVTDNVRASTRNILQPLRNGTVIAWTVDSMVGDTYSVDFLGRELRLNAMAPRIAQRHASASFWCYPHWRGERVAFEIERLPEPRDGEDVDSWAARWYAPYLDKLEQVVRGDPRNITTRFLTWREPNPDTSFGVRRTLIKTATTRPLAVRRGPEGWTPG
jgi:lauroyl/myristoyl acyltransferase